MPFIMNLIGGIGLKVWGYALIAMAVLGILFGIRQSGRLAERADNLKRNSEIKDEQLRAANNRPRTNDELDRVLRSGDF